MSFPIWCEIVCRSCAKTLPGHFCYNALDRRQFKTEANKAKWKLIDNDWLCRSCQDVKE